MNPRLRDRLLARIDATATSGKILAAAVDAFAEGGVGATRVEDLLLSAGVSRRTFYQHFADKDAVVHALYELVTHELATMFVAASGGARPPREIVGGALEVYFDLHRTDRPIIRALVLESLRADSPLFAARQRFRAQVTRALDGMFAVAGGRELDPLVAAALVSAVEGISLELLAADELGDPELARARAVLERLVDLVCVHADALPGKP
jgi:AcrR family transcriptional regulator